MNTTSQRVGVSIHLDAPVFERIAAIAKDNNRSVSGEIRHLVTRMVRESQQPRIETR